MVVLVLKMWKHAYNIIYSHTDVVLVCVFVFSAYGFPKRSIPQAHAVLL